MERQHSGIRCSSSHFLDITLLRLELNCTIFAGFCCFCKSLQGRRALPTLACAVATSALAPSLIAVHVAMGF